VLGESLIGKAIEGGTLDLQVHDLRDWTTDRHRSVDDESFGGGPGMVLKPEPLFAVVESLDPDRGRVLAMSPAGRMLDQVFAVELAAEPHVTLLCGRYEGFDERVIEGLPAEEVSIGDYVVSGGELPALVLIEAVTWLDPGVLATRRHTAATRSASPACSTTPSTHGRRSSVGCGYRRCWCRATTRRSRCGGARLPRPRPPGTGLTCGARPVSDWRAQTRWYNRRPLP
jgi:hypothetical protein